MRSQIGVAERSSLRPAFVSVSSRLRVQAQAMIADQERSLEGKQQAYDQA